MTRHTSPSPADSAGPPAEPNWRPQGLFSSAQLAADVRAWLLDDGSLTQRLTAQGRGAFRVNRLQQGWQVPLASERRLLDLPQRQVAIVREVMLQQGELNVVFARSVVPIASLQGKLAHLRRLENKPLGAILFGNAGMRRSPFELARISADSSYLPRGLLGPGKSAWGRRSRFEVYGHSVMVSEVFLEGFRPWPALIPLHRSRRAKVTPAIVGAKQ